MDVRIIGWSCRNIRGGLVDLDIDLSSDPSRWTLIQMPNGIGKTTTNTLFRWALTESEIHAQEVRGLRPNETDRYGEFELRISVNDEMYRLILKFDYADGTMTRWTSRVATEAGGLERGRLLPGELPQLLTQAFTKLFVFDGELAKSIRDINKKEASKAIHTLYRLDRIDALASGIGHIVAKQQQANEAKTRSDRGLGNINGRRNTARDRLRGLEDTRDKLEIRIRIEQASADDLRAQKLARVTANDDSRKKSDEVRRDLGEVERQIHDLASRTMIKIRNPAGLSVRIQSRLTTLAKNLHVLKLPKTISAEFFRELARQDICICGRPIGEKESETITHRATEFLADNQVAVINAMKEALHHSTAEPEAVHKECAGLAPLVRQRKLLLQKNEQIELELANSGDSELHDLITKLAEVESQVAEDLKRLDALVTTSTSDQQRYSVDENSNIPLAKASFDKLDKQYATETETAGLREQSGFVINLLKKIDEKASGLLRERVREATNEKLKTLLPNESIKVSKLDGALLLSSSDLNSKEAVSEGQSLAVAYAFLSSLFQDAPYSLPFVVDSPAVSLDVEVRREVANLIPELFNQVIFFVISSEKDGFADAFYNRPETRYITVSKLNGEPTKIEYGKEAFASFHAQEDELDQEVTS